MCERFRYLFSICYKHTILLVNWSCTNKQYIGSEVKYDKNTYHYKVGYDKDNLLKMYGELAKALDSSKLNDWSTRVNHSSISKFMNMDTNKQDISNNLEADYTFDMWADRKTKLIGVVSFSNKDEQDYETSVTLAQTYSSKGDEIPFKIEYTSKYKGKKPTTITVDVKVNSKTSALDSHITLDMSSDDSGLKGAGGIKITPSDKPVKISPPKGVINVFDSYNLSISDKLQSSENKQQAISGAHEMTSIIESYATDHSGMYPPTQLEAKKVVDKYASRTVNYLTPSSEYSYKALPAGCNNTSVKCYDFKIRVSKSLFGGNKDIITGSKGSNL